jgi:hypothetical protein
VNDKNAGQYSRVEKKREFGRVEGSLLNLPVI